jgi:flagellar biosynthetic protein FliO
MNTMANLPVFIKKWLETGTLRQKWVVGLLASSLIATGALFVMSRSSNTASDPLGSTPFYFMGVFIKLVAVLLLIVGSAVIYQRWMQSGPVGKSTRQLRLLETVRLSPKQALHLVTIGEQQFLIGATDQSIALISHVEGSEIPENPQVPVALDFGAVLRSIKG